MQTSEGGWGSQDGRPVVTRHSHRVINGTQGPPGPPGTQGRPGPAREPASGRPPSGRSVRAFPAASPTAHPGPGGRGRRQVWTDAQVWFSSAQQVTPRDALPRPPRTPHPAPCTRPARPPGSRPPQTHPWAARFLGDARPWCPAAGARLEHDARRWVASRRASRCLGNARTGRVVLDSQRSRRRDPSASSLCREGAS